MAALNDDASRVLVSHGASANGVLLNDAWVLDLSVGSNQQVYHSIILATLILHSMLY